MPGSGKQDGGQLWDLAHARGMRRRDFLRLMAAWRRRGGRGPGRLRDRGRQRADTDTGARRSPYGSIVRVERSADGGATWNDAELTGPQPQYSWALFQFLWDSEAGERVIMTRTANAAGNTQPDRVPFNEKGYLFNQPVPHPVRVV